jgi:hypothetical protein
VIDAERIAARMDELRVASDVARRALESLVDENQGRIVQIEVVVTGMRHAIRQMRENGHNDCAVEIERFANALSVVASRP